MEEEKKGFVIKDRRVFTQDEQEETKEAEKEVSESEEPGPKAEPAPKEKAAEPQLPEINFQTFVFSLNASALVQLGVMEDPATGGNEKNLPMVKQTIDMLSMLQEKTEGNLTKEESDMLKYILYDLRMRYVKEKE